MQQTIAIGAAIVPLFLCLRSGHFFKAAVFTVCSGLAALAAVCWLGAYTGIFLTMNPFTIAVSALLGIPGVMTMLLMRLLFCLP